MKTKEIGVQIFGKNFNFNVSENIPSDDFLEIVEYVESVFTRIRNETSDLDSFKLGLLAAINIAEQFFSLKKENEKLKTIFSNIDRIITPEEQGKPDKEDNSMSILFSP